MPKYRLMVAVSAAIGVAYLALPTATSPKTEAVNPVYHRPQPPDGGRIVTSSILKLDGRLPAAKTSPLISSASIDFVGTGGKAMSESVRTILAQARSAPPGQAGQMRKGGGEPSPRRSQSDDEVTIDSGYDSFDLMSGDEQVPETETALQKAHPELYIVACEAGCRPSANKIVYEVSRVAAPAAEIAKRRLETTSAQATDGTTDVATAENSVVCIAGCYDEKPARAVTKKADATEKSELAPRREQANSRQHLAKRAVAISRREASRQHSSRRDIPRNVRRVAAKDVKPRLLVSAASPVTVAAVTPAQLKVETRDSVKIAASKPKKDATALKRSRKVMTSRAKNASAWVTTVTRVDGGSLPSQPVSGDRGTSPAIRQEDRPGDNHTGADGWHAWVIRSDEVAGPPDTASTWGYVITVGR